MVDLGLQSNEGIIIQSSGVRNVREKRTYEDSLILTNINIIYINKGLFGKVKGINKYPLNQIKIVDGQAQVIIGNGNIGTVPQLQIFFKQGQEAFEFQSGKKEILKWVNEISVLLTGVPSPSSNKVGMFIPGSEELANTMKNTVGVFKDVLGAKKSINSASENVTTKCIGCMAPITGRKGETVKCKYCDTSQTL